MPSVHILQSTTRIPSVHISLLCLARSSRTLFPPLVFRLCGLLRESCFLLSLPPPPSPLIFTSTVGPSHGGCWLLQLSRFLLLSSSSLLPVPFSHRGLRPLPLPVPLTSHVHVHLGGVWSSSPVEFPLPCFIFSSTYAFTPSHFISYLSRHLSSFPS